VRNSKFTLLCVLSAGVLLSSFKAFAGPLAGGGGLGPQGVYATWTGALPDGSRDSFKVEQSAALTYVAGKFEKNEQMFNCSSPNNQFANRVRAEALEIAQAEMKQLLWDCVAHDEDGAIKSILLLENPAGSQPEARFETR
jgi:hypothetical protein